MRNLSNGRISLVQRVTSLSKLLGQGWENLSGPGCRHEFDISRNNLHESRNCREETLYRTRNQKTRGSPNTRWYLTLQADVTVTRANTNVTRCW